MQPGYIPWLGFFDLMDNVDKFIFLDDVKLSRHDWDVRNRIKTAQKELYLTIPVRRTKSQDKLKINEAVIDENKAWRKKHLKSIKSAYEKTSYFSKVYPFIGMLINTNIKMLAGFNIKIIISIAKKIGINKEFILSSKLKNLFAKKDRRLVAICKQVGCDQYFSPQGSAAYIEKDSPGGEFAKNNIKLSYQNYQHPIYNQVWGDFIPHMSIVDLLFNCGFNKALKIIRRGRNYLDYLSFRKSSLGKINENKNWK